MTGSKLISRLKLKKTRKIIFLFLGIVLCLMLLYDLLELLFASYPGMLHVYSQTSKYNTDNTFNTLPYVINVRTISAKDRASIPALDSAMITILADAASPLPLHKRGRKVIYSVWTSNESGRAFIIHKFMTFFWGFTGPAIYEITDPALKKLFCKMSAENWSKTCEK